MTVTGNNILDNVLVAIVVVLLKVPINEFPRACPLTINREIWGPNYSKQIVNHVLTLAISVFNPVRRSIYRQQIGPVQFGQFLETPENFRPEKCFKV